MRESDKQVQFITDLLELNEDEVLQQTNDRLREGESSFEILEDAQEAMMRVGKRYETGEYYISSMMLASEIFRGVLEILEPLFIRETSESQIGSVVLGTVRGDIHDIGKNIFNTLLRVHGFSVTDLGVDIDPEQFLIAIKDTKPDIVALSGLIAISYESMAEIIKMTRMLANRTLARVPFIIGGGTITEAVCAQVGADFWANDALIGVQLCKQIIEESN